MVPIPLFSLYFTWLGLYRSAVYTRWHQIGSAVMRWTQKQILELVYFILVTYWLTGMPADGRQTDRQRGKQTVGMATVTIYLPVNQPLALPRHYDPFMFLRSACINTNYTGSQTAINPLTQHKKLDFMGISRHTRTGLCQLLQKLYFIPSWHIIYLIFVLTVRELKWWYATEN